MKVTATGFSAAVPICTEMAAAPVAVPVESVAVYTPSFRVLGAAVTGMVPSDAVSETVGCGVRTYGLPFASFSRMVTNVDVVPSATRLVTAGSTVDCDDEIACVMAYGRVSATAPEVAIANPLPFAVAVRSPVAMPDVAIDAPVLPALRDHVTAGFGIGCEAALNTEAVSVTVEPIAVSVGMDEG